MPKLEKYTGIKSRFICPNCEDKRKTFTRYINEDGSHVAPEVGRCNREAECGYHKPPRDYYKENDLEPGKYEPIRREPPKPPDFINQDVFKNSLNHYNQNTFILGLLSKFDRELVENAVNQYHLGTYNDWAIFWQIDINRNVRTGKRMLFDPLTCSRYKSEGRTFINWMHKPPFNLIQCFFGEHLLKRNSKPVNIVESEKTAVICSIVYPEYCWLSSSGKQGLNAEKCRVLKLNDVTLYPDNDAFDLWSDKADLFGFDIYDGLLEYGGSYDLADTILLQL